MILTRVAGKRPLRAFLSFLNEIIVNDFKVCYNGGMVRVKAYAKLNFTLDITGASGGYHCLDSLVCTVDIYDLIKLKKRKDSLVTVEMHGQNTETLPYESNNAARAAEAYIRTFGTNGADITIYKNIPVGAGMGGSSADIAGVIRGLSRLYGQGSEAQLKQLADSLGSDTGYLLRGGWARLTGRGEKVESLDISAVLHPLLLLPREGVSTAECYRLYDANPNFSACTQSALDRLICGDYAGFARLTSNSLYAPACALNPLVGEAFKELEDFSPSGVCMTGSGSGVFALFETRELRDWAASRYRGKHKIIKLKTYIPKGEKNG
ncbi:MAG: 4-(cytidine 5'-diphospho)-2-C-methyl-D-erythritol kinase [Clostridia bacterium]|nr:4-(cytidine 5'-diphospho)-2-C-methyl-D-erythritol kinase [Clostridia bacterium]